MDFALPLDRIQSGCLYARSPGGSKKFRISTCFFLNGGKKHRSTLSRVKCSLLLSGLVKPRPMAKPSEEKQSEKKTMKKDALSEEIRMEGTTPKVDMIPSICAEIKKLVLHKRYREALEFFNILDRQGDYDIGKDTFDALINACIQLKSIRGVKRLYNYIVHSGFEPDLYMRNRVLLMHAKCGMVHEARYLFYEMPLKNDVSWCTMIEGLVASHDYIGAFRLFMSKLDYSDVGPRMLTPMIRAAAGLELISPGQQLHGCALKCGLRDDVYISCSLMDMYNKCGSIEDTQFIFDVMPVKTVVAWNTIISGYALHGYSEEALSLYYEMQEAGVQMNNITFSIIVRVCTRLASIEHAKQAHAGLVRHGFVLDIVANTTLVDFYCKWGRIEDAQTVFNRMPKKNVISWNALIAGYGSHGRGVEAVQLFEKMVLEGMSPNHVTFLAVLSSCSYSGLTDSGWEIFNSMHRDYKVRPKAMHYVCMIELLGREGNLDEALSLIRDAPFRPTLNMWAALLTACRIHKNFVLGKLAAEQLYGMEPKKLGNYVVLLNIYNKLGKHEEAAEVVQTLKGKGLTLMPACTWIEIKKKQEVFISSDKYHVQMKDIYENLDNLMLEISKHGYAPKGKTLLPDVDEHDQKSLFYHSEKLALSFGLINTPSGTPLQLVQNHRICNDCHSVIKLIAMVTERQIVFRDGSRFHRFENGKCSCCDYW
ncbi:unnamed protein product [Cuscuta europaea]|uniref:DYW domain-containing protein n=1 Tax=Cuscuta europaea TaxID=41803 RepID=A0A9P1E410_CUSEU|nr:unnamed protein product [Cuscuta europaea]CAH9077419.1 unnamed protein product [Cuscuta europaea]CAH9077423.1 unnamed protein product [Cuscuta europaea]